MHCRARRERRLTTSTMNGRSNEPMERCTLMIFTCYHPFLQRELIFLVLFDTLVVSS